MEGLSEDALGVIAGMTVHCAVCGTELRATSTPSLELSVTPCKKCQDAAEDRGWKNGHAYALRQVIQTLARKSPINRENDP